MSVFEFDDYKEFISAWILARPNKGRGESRRISELLRIHSTMVSHILKGGSHLSLEQAVELSLYLGLSELETDYFLELVQLARAGSHLLREKIQTRLRALKSKSQQLAERLRSEQRSLTEEDKAIFYSSWHFSAIRLLATLQEIDPQQIRQKLKLSSKKIQNTIEFLVRTGICEITSGGKLKASTTLTHLGAGSPHVWKHHQSWRIKAMDRYFDLQEEELMYSAPLTISKKDMLEFRERIIQLVEDLKARVEKTEPETIACLNIDWVAVL